MTDVLCGNLSVVFESRHGHRLLRTDGVRLDRFTITETEPAPAPTGVRGRRALAGQVHQYLDDGQVVHLHAPCGFGVSTLLRLVAAADGAAGWPTRQPVYLDVQGGAWPDAARRLVAATYRSDSGVQPTWEQCRTLLAQLDATVVLDHLPADPAWLLDATTALPRCRVVLGGATALGDPRRVQVARSTISIPVPGLTGHDALQLFADELPRPLTPAQERAALRITERVGGAPLRLRQAAALARGGTHSLESLAERVSQNPAALDGLSCSALPQAAQRVLAVLALAAGATVDENLVRVLTGLVDVRAGLAVLRGHRLVDDRQDRYGLPVCIGPRYLEPLAQYADAASSTKALIGWLRATTDPQAAWSGSAAGMALLKLAAERGDHESVARLAGLLEPALTSLGKRFEAAEALERGIDAARQLKDQATEGFLHHQRAVLHALEDDAHSADQEFARALLLRRRLGDADGVARTMAGQAALHPWPPAATLRPARPPRRLLGRLGAAGATRLALGAVAIVMSGAAALSAWGGSGETPGGSQDPTRSAAALAPTAGGSIPVASVAATADSLNGQFGGTGQGGRRPTTGPTTGPTTTLDSTPATPSTPTSTSVTPTADLSATTSASVTPTVSPSATPSPTPTPTVRSTSPSVTPTPVPKPLVAKPNSASFGANLNNDPPGTVTVSLANPNPTPVTVDNLRTTNSAFTASSKTCGVPIPARAGCELTITFKAPKVGLTTADLQVSTVEAGQTTVRLAGTGFVVLSVQLTTPVGLTAPAGAITGSGISCPPTCSIQITSTPSPVVLAATGPTAAPGVFGFAYWSTNCPSPTAVRCSLSVSGNVAVVATFSSPPGQIT